MSIAIERELTHGERVNAFQQAVNQVRSASHLLADHDLWAALDETKRCLFQLDRQLQLFKTVEPGEATAIRTARGFRHHGRRRGGGVDILPGSVALARKESGLSLRQLAGRDLTGAAICQIEKGKARPSKLTLELIAQRTGKPLEFFTGRVAV